MKMKFFSTSYIHNYLPSAFGQSHFLLLLMPTHRIDFLRYKLCTRASHDSWFAGFFESLDSTLLHSKVTPVMWFDFHLKWISSASLNKNVAFCFKGWTNLGEMVACYSKINNKSCWILELVVRKCFFTANCMHAL